MKKFKNTPTHIIIHHSVSARDRTKFETLKKAHIKKGWDDIGYHFVIIGDGKKYTGRSITYQGVHGGKNWNYKTIAICLTGDFRTEKPSSAQLSALRNLLDKLRVDYLIPKQNILGHREIINTICPGKNLMPWIKQYRDSNLYKSELNLYKNAFKEINQIINKLEFNN